MLQLKMLYVAKYMVKSETAMIYVTKLFFFYPSNRKNYVAIIFVRNIYVLKVL